MVSSGAMSLPRRLRAILRTSGTMSRENISAQQAEFLHRPVSKDGFAVDVVAPHRAEFAAIVRHGAVVSQHEIAIRRDYDFGIRMLVGELFRNVRLRHKLSVAINASAIDAYTVAGTANHAFDKALARVPRIAEHHNIAEGNVLQTVDQLVDEDTFLIFQARLHAAAFDFHRLINKENDEE